MRYLKSAFDFYLNSSIHVGMAAYALTWITLIEYQLGYDDIILYVVFYSTVVAYNFVKYFGLVKYHYRKYTKSLNAIGLVSLLAGIAGFYYAFQVTTKALLLLILIGSITFFYTLPFLPKKMIYDQQRNLRQISGFKIYVIAAVWALTTVLLPVLNNRLEIEVSHAITLVQRFVYVFVLMLPFEIRDLKFDDLKLATVPQQIGVKSTKILGVFLLAVFVALEFVKEGNAFLHVMAVVITALASLCFLVFAHKNQSKYYSAFWVEGLPIFWLCLLLGFS